MPLTATAVKNAKPAKRQKKLYDRKGLYIIIAPNGGKWWRFKYRFNGKEKLLSLGTYPEISLQDAREARDQARRLVAKGTDPSEHRKSSRLAARALEEESFELIAREWLKRQEGVWAQSTSDKALRRFELYIFPWLGSKPIAEITAPELLTALRRIEEQGIIETAHRVKALCGRVFRYGVATGRCERDPVSDLGSHALTPKKVEHRATITDEKKIGELLRAIDGYSGSLVTRSALKLGPLLFVRPGELRHAEWSEFDFENAIWRIPAEKMKMGREHLVPLATQTIEVLEELQPLTGRGKWVFPGERSIKRPMSENTVNAALRRLGFGTNDICGHGFRAMASTRLHEMGWKSDVIERQLAHLEQNKVKAAYSHAEFMPERTKMMQAWADYLGQQKARV